MKRLEGGFINQVYLDNGIVRKTFGNDGLVGISSERRMQNELTALQIFGGTIAPQLISHAGITLCQEFIEGETYEVKARRGEKVFEAAGKILAEIHNFKKEQKHSAIQHFTAKFERALQKAKPILDSEELAPSFLADEQTLNKWGTRYIHGDFWLGNILGWNNAKPKVIDWEFSGIGSPFEDFAIAELWILREFPGSHDDFWRGYGKKPDQGTIDSFLILRCVEFLSTTTLDRYLLEERDGFYHNKSVVLRSLLK